MYCKQQSWNNWKHRPAAHSTRHQYNKQYWFCHQSWWRTRIVFKLRVNYESSLMSHQFENPLKNWLVKQMRKIILKNIQLYHTGQYECSGMDKLLWPRIRVIESTRTSGSGRCSTGRYQKRKLDDLLTVHFWPDSWKLSNKKTVFLLPQLKWMLLNRLKSLASILAIW